MVQESDDGLVVAVQLDSPQEPRDWGAVRAWSPDSGPLWVHLEVSSETAQSWIAVDDSIPEQIREVMFSIGTRPRCIEFESATFLNLRGVNLNPGADPEDMIALRLWVDEHRVITLSRNRLMAVEAVRRRLEAGKGPTSAPELVAALSAQLIERIDPVLEEVDEGLEQLESSLDGDRSPDLHAELGALRRKAITLRRYLAPQRETLSRLLRGSSGVLEPVRDQLQEVADSVSRYVEMLQELSDRASVTRE